MRIFFMTRLYGLSVADPGSGAFLPLDLHPGYVFFGILDPGSRIPGPGSPTHISESLLTVFWFITYCASVTGGYLNVFPV
jgi:hypothetical protein